MRVIVSDVYTSERHHLEGDEEGVRSQLLDLYPFLLMRYGNKCSVKILVDALNKNQSTTAKILDSLDKAEHQYVADGTALHTVRYPKGTKHGQIHTQDTQLEAYRAAAEFLAGQPCSDKEMRQALLQADGDCAQAALIAHNLPATMLPDLEAVLNSTLKKAEEADDTFVKFKDVSSATESGKEFAEIIKKSSEEGEIKHVQLGAGKHNHGMLLARDSVTHQSYVLKPGSGKQNPIAGETESGSTQSQREACFYSCAAAMNLSKDMPECHLLLIDGQEYACMAFLSHVFKNFNDLKAHDPGLPKRLLSLYNDGTLHQWAAMDFILGNIDRNSGNVMASGDKVKLIDHGSAFAGVSFDPAKDGVSFVPYYLRPGVVGFTKLTTDEKLRKLPRLNAENEAKLKKWLLGLDAKILGQLITLYGIDPAPELNRLEKLQRATAYQTADLAILSAWVVG
jgi:hypothetical protein